ncbi:hypothetical protein [Candidatus Solirubrobacter pratensis]|uniref:hypothetical protein n=1 Tax=Candidatus Solirubrobacter pratensis TaxID=1298857 RepID=UPI0003FFE763|nr:hypothetical protein [Candidatus Solirubrobacter pratensis]
MPAPAPSTRLLRAVAAERDQLDRHRARMAEEADELRRALARIERGLAEIDERRALLDRVAGAGAESRRDAVTARGDRAGEGGEDAGRGDRARDREEGAGRRLRGPEIREAAVRALIERDAGEALHYRDWFALLVDAGHEIAGKDPLAVFLTQLSRSPVVRRGSGAGVYELDRHAGARLRATLEGLQRELRELTISHGNDLGAIRARRERLNAEIGRVERALEEIERVLGPTPPLAAAG